MFKWVVLSSIIIKQGFHVGCAEAPPHECDLTSELQIAKMHLQMFEYYCIQKKLVTLVR